MHSMRGVCARIPTHTRTYRVYKYIQRRYHIYISGEMCVFNRVMVDSGTIQFIASQEMARKWGQGGRAAFSLGGGSGVGAVLINSITPGWSRVHPVQVTASVPRTFVWSGKGWVGQESDASLAPSQARNGRREFSVESLVIVPHFFLQPL